MALKRYLIIGLLTFKTFAVINPPIAAVVVGSTLTSTYVPVCDVISNVCLTGITNTGKYYQHLMATNETGTKISFAMTIGNNANVIPSSTTSQKFYVVSMGQAAWDDIAVFNNLFIRTEEDIPNSNDITVHVW